MVQPVYVNVGRVSLDDAAATSAGAALAAVTAATDTTQ